MKIRTCISIWRSTLINFVLTILPLFIFTLSHIQLIFIRRLWKHTRKTSETPFKWKYTNWLELKTWWKKEKLLVLSNFFFCRHVLKMPSAAEASESICIVIVIVWGKGLNVRLGQTTEANEEIADLVTMFSNDICCKCVKLREQIVKGSSGSNIF